MKFFPPLLLSFLLVITSVMTANAEAPQPFIKFIRAPSFDMPIDCTFGEDCWVMNYVDMIPDDGKQTDPACLARTYDAHKGTDIAISDSAAMERGVNVLAPMDGIVKKVRDGEIDRWSTEAELEQIKKDRKECGNAILIEHGNGLETLYCHLKQGSISVKEGSSVKTGDIIAKVGLSGLTQFPHLHFGLIIEGEITDPFTGQSNNSTCGVQKKSLWNADLDVQYQPLTIQNAEFSDNVPELDKIERDAKVLTSISNAPPLLSFWAVLLGAREGDHIVMEIRDPNNKIFANRNITQDKTRARQFYYTGRKLDNTVLAEGGYTGTIKVTRTDADGKTQEWNTVRAILVQP